MITLYTVINEFCLKGGSIRNIVILKWTVRSNKTQIGPTITIEHVYHSNFFSINKDIFLIYQLRAHWKCLIVVFEKKIPMMLEEILSILWLSIQYWVK